MVKISNYKYMPRLFYEDVELEVMYREYIRNDLFNLVPSDKLIEELQKLQEKKDRIKIVANEELDRVIEKINNIEKYLKFKSNVNV